MKKLIKKIKTKIQQNEGAIALEYIILALLIVVVLAVFFMPNLKEVMNDAFTGVSGKITDMVNYAG